MANPKVLRALAAASAILAGSYFANSAAAQTRSSDSIVGITNSAIGFGIHPLDEHSSDTGALSIASVNQSFTGKDRTGATKTMNFIGETRTSADFGRLRSYTAGAVSNTYYNATNPIYANVSTGTVNTSGSPDGLVSLGFATFDDTLQFGGELQAGYKARYIFHIDGTNSGYGFLADLSANIAGNSADNFFITSEGFSSNNFTTGSYDINGITPQTIHVQFSTQFVLNTFDVPDGSNLSGTADFSATATLEQVEIVDSNGDPVTGVTVSSSSGTQYATTPEPSTVAVLLASGMLLARRRMRVAV